MHKQCCTPSRNVNMNYKINLFIFSSTSIFCLQASQIHFRSAAAELQCVFFQLYEYFPLTGQFYYRAFPRHILWIQGNINVKPDYHSRTQKNTNTHVPPSRLPTRTTLFEGGRITAGGGNIKRTKNIPDKIKPNVNTSPSGK